MVMIDRFDSLISELLEYKIIKFNSRERQKKNIKEKRACSWTDKA